MTTVNDLAQILNDTENELSGVFESLEWSEEEIAAAMRRHPDQADTIWHSFSLLTPTHDLMVTEFVYRAHCRELLDRVAAGEDTRPGTAVEVCCVCYEASQRAPLTSPATGLYMRMWSQAFPDKPVFGDAGEHHEALEGSRIDDMEADTRRKLTVRERTLGEIECEGKHRSEPVQCTYVKREDAAQLRAS